MKKLLLSTALLITMAFGASAQGGQDSWFSNWDDNRDVMSLPGLTMPNSIIGSTDNAPAPLGSGLLVLTTLGAGYAVARKKQK